SGFGYRAHEGVTGRHTVVRLGLFDEADILTRLITGARFGDVDAMQLRAHDSVQVVLSAVVDGVDAGHHRDAHVGELAGDALEARMESCRRNSHRASRRLVGIRPRRRSRRYGWFLSCAVSWGRRRGRWSGLPASSAMGWSRCGGG